MEDYVGMTTEALSQRISGCGVGNGGAVGTAGAVGMAGAGGMGYPCNGLKPAAATIADFNINAPTDIWKDVNGLRFGLYSFPDPNNGGPNLKVGGGTGVLVAEAKQVTMPMGFGVKMQPCVNARISQFTKGVQFTISGTWSNATVPLIMAVKLGINQNLPVSDIAQEGMCSPPAGTQDPHPFCDAPHYDLMVLSQKSIINLDFIKFSGGKPNDGVLTDQIKNIEWLFVTLMNQQPYDATVTIDDVMFY